MAKAIRIFDNKTRGYVMDATGLDNTIFYPVILRIYAGEDGNPQELFDYTGQMGVGCEISSEDMTNYGPNFIKFYAKCDGDSKMPESISVNEYGTYNKNQITIGCIGYGNEEGNICVWVRGGTKYAFQCNAVPTLYTEDYESEGGEIFSIGPNLYGGTNTNVDVAYTPTGEPPAPTEVILYNTTGQNTDGAMTQKATTDELNTKVKDIKVNGTVQPKVDGVVELTITGGGNVDDVKVNNVSVVTNKIANIDLTGYVEKEAGKGLSTNDLTDALKTAYDGAVTNSHTHSNKTILDNTTASYTTAEQTKLAGIEAGAEVNDITDVQVNGSSVVINKAANITVPTKTSDLTNDSGFIDKDVNNLTNYYDKTAVDAKVSSVYKYKGSVSTYADLPSSGQVVGDVYNVATADPTHHIKAGDNVAWNGTAWDPLAGDIDLTDYYTKTETNTLLGDKVDKVSGKQLSTEDYTTAEKTKLNSIESGAEVNVQTDWNQSDSTADDYLKNKPQNLVQDADYIHTDNNYTTNEKNKLSGVETGAEVNTIEAVKVNGTALTPDQNKAVDIDLTGKENTHWVGTKSAMDLLPLVEGKVYETTDEEGGGGGGSSLPDYSLDEQDTGIKWIDDKTIYQKTFQNNIGTATTNTTSLPSGIESIIEFKGTFGNGTGIMMPLGHYGGSTDWSRIYATTSTVYTAYGSTYSSYSKIETFTIYYTKTGS